MSDDYIYQMSVREKERERNKYAGEEGKPSVPACARASISLRFDGKFLTMNGGEGKKYPAVSGRPDDKGTFDYSANRQHEGNAGPIPEGEYWVKPSQMWTHHWYNIAAPRGAWGDHRLTIHVMPGTNTFDRGGFFIHGGTHPGSAGCINLHDKMEDFVSDLQAAAEKSDCYIPLTVKY